MRFFFRCFQCSADREESPHSSGTRHGRLQTALILNPYPAVSKSGKEKAFNSGSTIAGRDAALNFPCSDRTSQSHRTAIPSSSHIPNFPKHDNYRQVEIHQIRDCLVLKCLPAIVTMVTLDGRVLLQNPQSKSYYGDRTGDNAAAAARPHTDILSLLFAFDELKLDRMHETLSSQGRQGLWKAVVRVPLSLNIALDAELSAVSPHGFSLPRTEPLQATPTAEVRWIDLAGGPALSRPISQGRHDQPDMIAIDFEQAAAAAVPSDTSTIKMSAAAHQHPKSSHQVQAVETEAEAAAAAGSDWVVPGPKAAILNRITNILLLAGKEGNTGNKAPSGPARPNSSGYSNAGGDTTAYQLPLSHTGLGMLQEPKKTVSYNKPNSSQVLSLPTTGSATIITATATATATTTYTPFKSQPFPTVMQSISAATVGQRVSHVTAGFRSDGSGTGVGGAGGGGGRASSNTDNSSFVQHIVATSISGGYQSRNMQSGLTASSATAAVYEGFNNAKGPEQQQLHSPRSQATSTRTLPAGCSTVNLATSSRGSVEHLALCRGDSGVHDPLATSTFATLAGNMMVSNLATRTSVSLQQRPAPVVPRGNQGANRSRNSDSIQGAAATSAAPPPPPLPPPPLPPPGPSSATGSWQAATDHFAQPKHSTQRRPHSSFYLGTRQRLPTIRSYYRSSTSTSASRALTFALSLGTSPFLSPQPPSQQHDPQTQCGDSRLDDDKMAAAKVALCTSPSPSFRSVTLTGLSGGLSLGAVPSVYRRSSISRFTSERIPREVTAVAATAVAATAATPHCRLQNRCVAASAGVIGNASSAAALTGAGAGAGAGDRDEETLAARMLSTAGLTVPSTAEWGSSLGPPQLPDDVLSGDGPMFGLPFAIPDSVKQQLHSQGKQRNSDEWLAGACGEGQAGRPLQGPACKETCVGKWQQEPVAEGSSTNHPPLPSVVLPRRREGDAELNLGEGDGGGAQGTVAAAAAVAAAQECWHEVWVSCVRDPVTGQDALILTQTDVTAKVIAERHLALVMETEHRLVEQLFPRHILQYITEQWTAAVAEAEAKAASSATGGHWGSRGPDDGGGGGGGGAAAAAVAAGNRSSRLAQPTGKQDPCSHTTAISGGSNLSLHWRPVIRDCSALATTHSEVTLLFADIKGFTPMCKQVEPCQTMTLLNELYSRYDALLDKYGVYKVETIGDCYFVAGGLMREDEDGMAAVCDRSSREDPLHAERVLGFAKAMLVAASEVLMPTNSQPVEIRVGLHTGPVVSGVVGTRMPRFCLFGDTVNTASRMESTGVPGSIHASEATFQRLPLREQRAGWKATGGIEVKDKGLMQTYLWTTSE